MERAWPSVKVLQTHFHPSGRVFVAVAAVEWKRTVFLITPLLKCIYVPLNVQENEKLSPTPQPKLRL